jgi:Na+(H+)/acetate symporter ActP
MKFLRERRGESTSWKAGKLGVRLPTVHNVQKGSGAKRRLVKRALYVIISVLKMGTASSPHTLVAFYHISRRTVLEYPKF